MTRTKLAACAFSLTLLLAGPGETLAAYGTEGSVHETTNYNQYSNNPIGVGFGSDAELGASGSTPGFIINREAQSGTVRLLAADSTNKNSLKHWGWLGLLGLLGLLRFRRSNDGR